MAQRFQFTTDVFRGYIGATGFAGNVKNILADCCDYSTETKAYKKDPEYAGQRMAAPFEL
ncbi:MAG TPA: hypothetical protein VGO59_18480 [Verrucomicrobiae bacterium]